MLVSWITLVSILITVVSSAPLSLRDALAPKDDPFYKPAAGFENVKPGTILRSRILREKSLAAFSAFPQNIKGVYQFLYRTTDALGIPTAAVTTLMVPINADPTKLVSYQVAEDSPASDCAPSYSFQKGTSLQAFNIQAEILFIDTLLGRGYYVTVADYEGPGSFFTVGKMSGNGVLDSIRAVLSSGGQTGLRADAKIQLWGYSGGALATGWAVQQKATYAPELNIIGATMGGTPVNLNATLNAVNKTPACALIPAGVHGLSGQYRELATHIDSILKPEKRQAWMDAKNYCILSLAPKFANQDIYDYFTQLDYTNDPIFTKVLNENTMGKDGTPKIPLYMYHSTTDLVVPIGPAKDMFNTWCSSGANIEFVEDQLSDHTILLITGAANAIRFMIDGFEGVRKSGCSKRTIATSALDPGSINVFGKFIYDDLNALLGGSVGPNGILDPDTLLPIQLLPAF